MDNVCEVKLNVFAAMHRMIDRALYLEQSVEGLVGGLSQAVPHCRAAVVVSEGEEVRFFFTQSPEGSGTEMEKRVRDLYKTGFDLVFRIPQAFVVLSDGPGPLFLDRKAFHSIRKEQVRLLGAPIVMADEVAGAIVIDRFFSDRVPMLEDVQLLSMLATFLGRILGLQSQVRRREEALVEENRALRARVSEEGLGLICFGRSEAARTLEASIRKVASADAPVLIGGAPGTGKSSIARIVHELSRRGRFPFVRVHCSLPEEVLEKELFGGGNGLEELHGPIPSAQPRGAFERAAGGSLLLDEVGELSAAHQVKLLDILEAVQNGGFPVSGPKGGADVRLVSVSSIDLSSVRAGAFRKDLLGRLATLQIHVPPIRERKEDIPFLIEHFMAAQCRKQGKKIEISPRALRRLCEYDWPGNISEIKNTVIRLVVMAGGPEIEVEDIESVLCGEPDSCLAQDRLEAISPWSRLDKIEIKEVSAALERNKWIRRKAADELGLTFRQMNYRVKKYGLDALINEGKSKK